MAMTAELFLVCLLVGVVVGIMSAMFGIGGGVIMVPFIVIAFDQSQQAAEGTSLMVVVPTAIAGVIAHRKRGYIDVRVAVPVAIAGVVGAFFGVRFALVIEPENLRSIFGVFTILVAVRLLRDSRRSSDPPDQAGGANTASS